MTANCADVKRADGWRRLVTFYGGRAMVIKIRGRFHHLDRVDVRENPLESLAK